VLDKRTIIRQRSISHMQNVHFISS